MLSPRAAFRHVAALILFLVITEFSSALTCLSSRHCKAGRVCERFVCRIRRDHPCNTRLTVKCQKGTQCVAGRCRRIATVGQTCRRPGSDYRECAHNLVCQRHVCRIRREALCTRHRKLCEDRTVCVGTSHTRRCKKPIGAGQRCGVDPFWVCQSNFLCQHKICRVRKGGLCLGQGGRTLPCVKGSSCVGPPQKKVCKRPIGPGGKCNAAAFRFCERGLTCERGTCKIRANKSCLRNSKASVCVSGTHCVGTAKRKICRKPMQAGGRCNVDPFWVCANGLTCERHVFKIPHNKDCTKNMHACVSGTKCVGTKNRKLCRKPRNAGGKCRDSPFNFCRGDLKCQSNRCMIRRNKRCDGKERHCEAGSNCVGPAKRKRCKKPMKAGQQCERDPYWVCEHGLICEKHVCKIPVNGNCLRNVNSCVSGTVCVGSKTEKKCRRLVKPGGRCGKIDIFSVCQKGLVCEQGKCKIREGRSCTENADLCQSGAVCVGNRRKLCKRPMNVGRRCLVDPFWVCLNSLVCQDKVCRLRERAVCTRAPKFCAKGLACVGTSSRKECRPLLSVGSQCKANNPFNKCVAGSECFNGRCRLLKNRSCNRTPKLCTRDLHCVGEQSKKKCKNPMDVGQRCQTDPFWVCRTNLVCENKICKLPENAPCPDTNSVCISSSRCVGRREKFCRKPVPINGLCNNDLEVCAKGLVCNSISRGSGRCKVVRNSDCRKAPNSCESGTRCVRGRCKSPSPTGGVCNNTTGEYCGPRATCQSGICLLREGSTCTTQSEDLCATGLVCAPDGKSGAKECKTAVPTLGKCDTDKRLGMQCMDGLLCDIMDDRCKIARHDECTKNQSACISGTKCLGDGELKLCTTPMLAGEPCAVDPFWACEEGLVCEDYECKVVRGGKCNIPFHTCGRGLSCGSDDVCV